MRPENYFSYFAYLCAGDKEVNEGPHDNGTDYSDDFDSSDEEPGKSLLYHFCNNTYMSIEFRIKKMPKGMLGVVSLHVLGVVSLHVLYINYKFITSYVSFIYRLGRY